MTHDTTNLLKEALKRSLSAQIIDRGLRVIELQREFLIANPLTLTPNGLTYSETLDCMDYSIQKHKNNLTKSRT